MKSNIIKQAVLSALFSISCTGAYAGDFTNVPFTTPDATVVNGANNPAADPLFIESTSTWVAGFENLVAQTVNYTTTAGGNYTLTLLDFHENDDFLLEGEELGDIYDMVYRDSRDNKLVFGTRVILDNVPESELNFISRAGFTGFETDVAWTFSGNTDLRMYNAARTSSEDLFGPFAGDEDVVRMKSDVSFEEGNPFSGLYLIKTNAQYYTFAADSIGYVQAGEEGQEESDGSLSGFRASATPVPETDTYAMLLAGLGMMGFVARRRNV